MLIVHARYRNVDWDKVKETCTTARDGPEMNRWRWDNIFRDKKLTIETPALPKSKVEGRRVCGGPFYRILEAGGGGSDLVICDHMINWGGTDDETARA